MVCIVRFLDLNLNRGRFMPAACPYESRSVFGDRALQSVKGRAAFFDLDQPPVAEAASLKVVRTLVPSPRVAAVAAAATGAAIGP
jgi:hypothetical protein